MALNKPQTQEEYDTGRALLLATVAALGGFLFGFDTAVINGAVTAVRDEFQMGPFLTGFTVSSALLGCVVGANPPGWLSDRQLTGHLFGTPLAGERGAVGYDNATLAAAKKDGIVKETRDRWRRATSQAAPALLALTRCTP